MNSSAPVSARDSTPPRKVVVTGCARGIGHACALHLAGRGYDIAIADLIDPIDTAHAVRAAGIRALPIVCDGAVPSDVTKTINTVLVCKAVVPGMTDRGFGRIINISSNTVGLPVEGVMHYVASKAAVIGFTRAGVRGRKPWNHRQQRGARTYSHGRYSRRP
jgi:NAD(P)-dependent dehydrogenase (short-subunit alcohol dehydrogenase family)